MSPRDRLMAVLEKHEPDCIPVVLQSVISSKLSKDILCLSKRETEIDRQSVAIGTSSIAGGLTYQAVQNLLRDIVERNPRNWKMEIEKIANAAAKSPINPAIYSTLGVDAFFYSSTPGDVRVLDEKHVINEFGSISKYGNANGELIVWYEGGYLKTPEERDQWALPMPMPERVEGFRKTLKTYGEKVYPIAFVVGIFELTWESMGFTDFARNLRTNPDFIKRVYGEHTKFDEELVKLFIDAGAEILAIGDDVAYKNNLMVSPKMWAEFVEPGVRRIINVIHNRGALVFMHSDGYVTPLIGLIAEAGYDGVQSLEPLAGVNLAEVKEKYGDRLGLIGGIDTSQLLPFGTQNDVEKAVKEAIKAAGRGGGYAIGPCTEIHWKCRLENVLAMIKYARKYGKYPLEI